MSDPQEQTPWDQIAVEGFYMGRSIADFQRACKVHIAEEQRRPNPDTALIALLCDAVRCSRELSRAALAGIGISDHAASSDYTVFGDGYAEWDHYPHETTNEYMRGDYVRTEDADKAYDALAQENERLQQALAQAQQRFDMHAHLQRQREWSGRTFGPGDRAKGVIDHIRKELREIEADPSDIKEWIDVVILALDGAWRAGYSPDQIVEALVAKQRRNEQRQWPDWRTMPTDRAIEHVRGVTEARLQSSTPQTERITMQMTPEQRRIEQLEAILAAIPDCPACKGDGWTKDGSICPTCDGAPHIIGGTGKITAPQESR